MRKVSIFVLLALSGILLVGAGYADDAGNRFSENAFPLKVSSRVFSIPLKDGQVMIVCPASMEGGIGRLRLQLRDKSGRDIPFRLADSLSSRDLAGKHLILIGNISDNRWIEELYRRRHAFADACFPGPGGVIIHPATSLWDGGMNVLVIGVSRESDLETGFSRFLDLLARNEDEIRPIHFLKTGVPLPTPPESVEAVFEDARKYNSPRELFMSIANWGFLYFLTGERKWADHFRDGFHLCLERGRKSGKWIPEQWTMMYFCLWNLFHVWELLDDDPYFTLDDRKTIEDVLWGYTQFALGRPYLDERYLPAGEPRQNHSTFLSLSLFFAHRYYSEKYGMSGLEPWAVRFRRCFEEGQALTYRPNDDGGDGYQVLAPGHYLDYALANKDDSYFSSGRMKRLVDLMAATIDNRGDPVTFGDVGGYSRWKAGDVQPEEVKFFSMAAWKYRDGEYQWLFHWLARDRVPGVDVWSPLATGLYAVDLKEKPPNRFLGVFPVVLDEPSLRWSARRSENGSQLPLQSKTYLDKIAFRRSFDPQDEYMLLDGTSTFAHGHLDGNTVTRLTWKDRIWLFDLHYIKASPREHNGVVIVRDGVQDAPPPLTSLDLLADFDTFGTVRTTSHNYNGADWQRHIVWKKGRYFLFLDRIVALDEGSFRFENRWRTRGECRTGDNELASLAVRQGEMQFHIKTADGMSRKIVEEPDDPLGYWNYPYGNGAMSVWLGREKAVLPRGGSRVFASLMFATDSSETDDRSLLRLGDDEYLVRDGKRLERIGLDPAILRRRGIESDCPVFIEEKTCTSLIGATRLRLGDARLDAFRPLHVVLDRGTTAGRIVITDEGTTTIEIRNLTIAGLLSPVDGRVRKIALGKGTYRFRCRNFPLPKNRSDSNSIAVKGRSPELPLCSIRDFGIELAAQYPVPERVTAMCSDGDRLLCGDATGRILRLAEGRMQPIGQIPGKRPLLTMTTADADGDGQREIFSGDDRENLFCHGSQGTLRWSQKLTKFNGPNANVTDIAVGPIGETKASAVLAATNGWKLVALTPDGRITWESFIRYHPLTRVRIFGDEKGKPVIAVGTVYQTPLNVVSGVDGKVAWFTWEQTGSESLAKTEYCDKHLTDMVFADTNLDGKGEIVFGTEYNSVYALRAEDGRREWKALVGDAVTVMRTMEAPGTGEIQILVATSGGDLVKLDRRGERIGRIEWGSGITGLEVIRHPACNRCDIVVSTEDGAVFICDETLGIRAAFHPPIPEPTIGLRLGKRTANEIYLFAATPSRVYELRYRPFCLPLSRHF